MGCISGPFSKNRTISRSSHIWKESMMMEMTVGPRTKVNVRICRLDSPL